MGEACSLALMERWEMRSKFWSEKLKGRDHLKNLDVEGRIILKYILAKSGGRDMDWTHFTQDRDQLRALVNTIMNFLVP
jgi:hypothetical protein